MFCLHEEPDQRNANEASKHRERHRNQSRSLNRIVLLSDGVATEGERSAEMILEKVLTQGSIMTSTPPGRTQRADSLKKLRTSGR